MSGDSVLRLYVYGLVLALVLWALFVSWLITRAAWRMVRGTRPEPVAAPSVVERGRSATGEPTSGLLVLGRES